VAARCPAQRGEPVVTGGPHDGHPGGVPGPGPTGGPPAGADGLRPAGSNGQGIADANGSRVTHPATAPGGMLAASPFDEHGRLIAGSSRTRVLEPAPRHEPLGWAKSGAIPLGTGPFTLTGGLSLTGSLGLTLGRRSKRKRPTVSGFDPVVRGRGLTRLSSRPVPTTRSELQRACVRWAVTLWVITVLIQRFAVPSQPIALLLPVALLWCLYGLVRGVLEVDRHRFGWWLAIAGSSAVIVPLQYALVPRPIVSLTSWGLLMTTWLVFVFRMADRRRETYIQVLRGVVKTCMWLSTLIVVMMVSQVVIPYQDWLAKIFPKSLLLQGFVISYPISYQSPFYKGNGWIGLEPSVVSFQLGVGLLAALLLRRKMLTAMWLGVGMLCTTAGSGPAIVLVGLLVIAFSPMRWALARYALLLPPLIAFAFTPWAQPIVSRATEGTGSNSSTGTRAVVPYEVIWPQWIGNPASVLLGRGPGSSQQLADDTHITGLLVPTPIKIFFDYGVLAGLGVAIFLLFMYLSGPSLSMGISLALSLWALQPGTTTMVFVIAVPLLITWWTPKDRRPIELDAVPSPHASIEPPPGGRPRMKQYAEVR
jgi:hypothetical protein